MMVHWMESRGSYSLETVPSLTPAIAQQQHVLFPFSITAEGTLKRAPVVGLTAVVQSDQLRNRF